MNKRGCPNKNRTSSSVYVYRTSIECLYRVSAPPTLNTLITTDVIQPIYIINGNDYKSKYSGLKRKNFTI